VGFRGVSRDITQRKQAERNLLKIQNALERKVKERTRNLQESNVALEVLLKKRENDRRDVEEHVILNIRESISPYIERLKNSPLKDRQKVYLEIIERNLKEIAAPFMRGLSDTFHKLTPTEIQVINLVKQEKTTKEMANFLGVSPRTVEYHRDNIRKKLGIANQKINLRSYLLSIR
jgi:DNA-binding NarL/FixJ family response regulator